jgi:hypothetical protein
MLSILPIISSVLLLIDNVFRVFLSSSSLEALERGLQEASQEFLGRLITTTLEAIDIKLMTQRDKSRLRAVGKRQRELISLAGRITINRRLYRDQKTGQYVFLLDQHLGLAPHARLTPSVEKACLSLGTISSFRQSANIISTFIPTVSHNTIWKCCQDAGKTAAKQAANARHEIFEDGVVPEATRQTKELHIEADGVYVNLQGSKKRKGELKMVVAYEGKEEQGSRRTLKQRRVAAGLRDGQSIWEEASAHFARTWDMSALEKVSIGGDGAEWVKAGKDYFSHATLQLDPFHLRRNITRALESNTQSASRLAVAINQGTLQGVQEILGSAAKKARGPKRKRITDLERYICNNWAGIQAANTGASLGAIEGQNRHILCARMKHRGCRWSEKGSDYMARLLTYQAEGNLESLAKRDSNIDSKITEIAAGLSEQKEHVKTTVNQAGDWLQARMPALTGPQSGRLWIKQVLRGIAEAGLVS